MRFHFLLIAGSVVTALGMVEACGGDSGIDDGGTDGMPDTTTNDVTQPIDSGGNDVVTTTDGGTDAANDVTTTTDASDGGGAQDSGQFIGTWQCGSVTVSDCTQCTGYTQPCAYCSTTDASVLSGVCVLVHTNCFNSIPNGFQDCQCTDASTCPESYQVCTQQGRCHTCEDNTNNTSLKCENGGTCNATDGGCL